MIGRHRRLVTYTNAPRHCLAPIRSFSYRCAHPFLLTLRFACADFISTAIIIGLNCKQVVPSSSSCHPMTSFALSSTFSRWQFLTCKSAVPPSAEGSLCNVLAEMCYFHVQNLPTIMTLLPRTGLALTLLLSFFTNPSPTLAAS